MDFGYSTCTYRKANNPRNTTPGDMTARELMRDWAAMMGGILTGKMLRRGTTFEIYLSASGETRYGCFYEVTCWKCGKHFMDVQHDDPSGAIGTCPICGAIGEF